LSQLARTSFLLGELQQQGRERISDKEGGEIIRMLTRLTDRLLEDEEPSRLFFALQDVLVVHQFFLEQEDALGARVAVDSAKRICSRVEDLRDYPHAVDAYVLVAKSL